MVVIFTCKDQVGCTFLNWSFHWLSGSNHYWFHEKKSWQDLPKNPLARNNAHLFEKNEHHDLVEWKQIINDFLNFDTEKKDFAFYGGARKELKTKFNYALQKKIKTIFVGTDYDRYIVWDRTKTSVNQSENEKYLMLKEQLKMLFSTVPNLNSLIDTKGKARDFLSFSLKYLHHPADSLFIENENFLHDENFMFINFRNFLIDGEECLRKMFRFLGREIDKKRLNEWNDIYYQWREFMLPILNFYDDLPIILSSVVAGRSFPLKKYKLDLLLESVIQHELMKHHKNRLVVSNMDRFPEDTKDLTQFLRR